MPQKNDKFVAKPIKKNNCTFSSFRKFLGRCSKILTRLGLIIVYASARHLGRTRRVRAVPEGRQANDNERVCIAN